MNRSYTNDKKQNQQLECEEQLTIPDALYDTLCNCFKIKRVIDCNPMTLPLRAKEFIFHDLTGATFGALPYTKIAWLYASLALPAYKVEHLTKALEQAMYIAHAHRHTQPSSHILILPNWKHSPYLARNFHSSYTQRLTSIPYLQLKTPKSIHTTQDSISTY